MQNFRNVNCRNLCKFFNIMKKRKSKKQNLIEHYKNKSQVVTYVCTKHIIIQ